MRRRERSVHQGGLFTVVIVSVIFAAKVSAISPSPSKSFELPRTKINTSSPVFPIKEHRTAAPGPGSLPQGFASHPQLVPPSALPIHDINVNKPPRLISPSVEHQAAVSSPPSLNPPKGEQNITSVAPSTTHPLHNISSHGRARSQSLPSNPLYREQRNGNPAASPPNEMSRDLHPVHSSYTKGFSTVMSPRPHEVAFAPLTGESHGSSSSPVASPISHDMKPASDAHAPVSSHLNPSGLSPSPLPSNLHPSETSTVISPTPHEMERTSNSSHSYLPSHPPPSVYSPLISPTPHEVGPPNFTQSSPEISPTSHEVKEPSNFTDSSPLESSPVISPTPHETVNPSNITHAPSPSHPKPLGSSPAISPAPHETKNPSNITHAPLASNPKPIGSSPMISPAPPELKDLSNITRAPLPSLPKPSRLAPTISPIPQELTKPSNATPPLPSHPLPSESSPVMSPKPSKVSDPSNITRSPSASNPKSSELSPARSPAPHEVNEPSNITHSPLPSHEFSSESSPVISPAPHELKDPSNGTNAPLASHLKPSGSSPAISPTPPEKNDSSNVAPSPVMSPKPSKVSDPSNITRSPSASNPKSSELSPARSPAPHEVNEPSNITRSPLPSHEFSSESSPVISPAPHELKDPSNGTNAPLASHLKPSGSSPAISPTPPEKNDSSNVAPSPVMSPKPSKVSDPSNITRSPSASNPKSSELSPARSPAPHEVNEPSNITHSPLPSHEFSSESSPVISPAPHELKDPSNGTNAPLASHLKPSGSSPAISPTPPEKNDSSNVAPSPLPSHSLPSPDISPTPHEVNPSNSTHAPLNSNPKPSNLSPASSPTPHELKEPSNVTHSPLPSHPFPSVSSPEINPTPHELKDPSNITHSPSPSQPFPLISSPRISPTPHEVKYPSNITNSPSPSGPSLGVKGSSNKTHAPLASYIHPSGSSPRLSPIPHVSLAPSPSERANQTSALAPLTSVHQRNSTVKAGSPAFSPLPPPSHNSGPMISTVAPQIPPVSPSNWQRNRAPPPYSQVPSISPSNVHTHPPVVPKNNKSKHQAPPPNIQAPSYSPIQAPFPSTRSQATHAPSQWPSHSPILPPSGAIKDRRAPPPLPFLTLPPPPPNSDCRTLTCLDPVTYPPTGSPCACVIPIKVGLRLGIALFTFFPLVSDLALEIASGVFVNQSQVRIMGANAASDPEKTTVMIYLVPLGGSFDMHTALLIFQRFWHKQVGIKATYFGDYEVLYVTYPGLPPSPPTVGDGDGGTFGDGENGRAIKPLGVAIKKTKRKVSGSLIAIVVLSSVIVLVVGAIAAWLLLLKCRGRSLQPPPTTPQQALSPCAKSSVARAGPLPLGSGPSSTSASFNSSIAGSSKTFSLLEIERATDRFHELRIIGEGGFGRVYQGTLEDGTMVAVKVLKRDDQQGGREFLAEVEMLSRLHHRNLVKLIGICTDETARCLVYELIPNGSVESHLHGMDKETSPLDWNARMKIALGAARGLAYLHEDSSPRVIHRDFKSSNILLEYDFTPKVSDFGLARTALDEGNDHISTRVMGTFGYVAPEYAMTGHLLVKSDVYSYGVVLLELLSGRKPVDMSQPPGQENLVSWARPLLTSTEGLSVLIDPALGVNVPFDSLAKVAAIASMCVQPEVSHRPFMGEVVQALKLVCNENNNEFRRSFSQDGLSTKDSVIRISNASGQEERVMSEADMFCTSAAARDASGSFRRYSNSGPLRQGYSQKLWQRDRGFLSGSLVETGMSHSRRLELDMECGEQWPP